MSTTQTSREKSLSGVRVLVGRARHQAGALSGELRKLGATVIEIPFIEIRKPRSFRPLDGALRNLNSYDWLILTSVNGAEALWARMARLRIDKQTLQHLRMAAIGPATKKAIEQGGIKVDVVPKEYIAESVVRSLRRRIRGKRVLLVRAKVARDVIPRELRKAGAQVDVVEAYETVVPKSSRARLRRLLLNPAQRPHLVTFTSSSTVRNFVQLLAGRRVQPKTLPLVRETSPKLSYGNMNLGKIGIQGVRFASIGPVTSATLRAFDLPVDIEALQFNIPGLVESIVALVQAVWSSNPSQ
jgi:uroporphyrinogen-III synthase